MKPQTKHIAAATGVAVALTLAPMATAQDVTETPTTTTPVTTTPATTTEAPTPPEPETPALPEFPGTLSYPASTFDTTSSNRTLTVALTGADELEPGSTYTLDESTVPQGWVATVSDKGTLTVTFPTRTASTPNANIRVTVASDKYAAPVTKTAAITVQSYATKLSLDEKFAFESTSAKSVPVGGSTTLRLRSDLELPRGTTFTATNSAAGWETLAGSTPLDNGTVQGVVSLKAPSTESEASITLTATLPDGSTARTTHDIAASPRVADKYEPTYGTDLTILPGVEFAKDFPITFQGEGDPDISRAEILATETGGDFEVHYDWVQNKGSFQAFSVSSEAPVGSKITLPVRITYTDGTVDTLNFEVTVVNTLAAATPVVYGESPAIIPGATKTFEQTTIDLPEGTAFSIISGPVDAWGATIDPVTGALNVTAPKNAAVGDKATFQVYAKYSDGSHSSTPVTVAVVRSQAAATSPEYLDAQVRPGESVTIENTGEAFPEGAVVTPVVDTVTGGWDVSVVENNALKVTPPSTAEVGDALTFDLLVKYNDGSADGQSLTVTVSVYTPDVIKRVIQRTVTVEVPPTQEEIDRAIRERNEQLAREGKVVGADGVVRDANTVEQVGIAAGRLANTGASVIGLAIIAGLVALVGGLFAFRKKN